MQHVEELSGGRVVLAAGTLYGALSTMVEKGWIAGLSAEGDSRKKEYQITDRGRRVLGSAGYLTYQFRDCDPGEYAVRLELLEELPEHPDSQRYIQFVEETGAEYLGHCLRWVYFTG